MKQYQILADEGWTHRENPPNRYHHFFVSLFEKINLGENQTMEFKSTNGVSGFVKIFRAWDEQHWMKPMVSEDAVHELTSVKLVYKLDEPKKSSLAQPSKDLEKDLGKKTREETREENLKLIEKKPKVTQKELSEVIGISPKGIEWQIKQLKNDGVLKRIDSTKGGYWEVKR